MKSKTAVARGNGSIRRLNDLGSTEFENLIFDLMVLRGMVNVVWRTPGADGGRDIEGYSTEIDLSGAHVAKKWFIECKRYSNSVDWPTIYEKLAYADSNQADYLLLCTTANFSPAATTQVSEWNAAKRLPIIRLWPGHELSLQINQYPDLMLKYRLVDFPSMPGKSFLSLALALSKSVSSHYSNIIFSEQPADLMLKASQAIADLILKRMEDIEQTGTIQINFQTLDPQLTADLDFADETLEIDESGLKAFLLYLSALSNERLKITPEHKSACRIESNANLIEIFNRYKSVFVAIATWANFEISMVSNSLRIEQRR